MGEGVNLLVETEGNEMKIVHSDLNMEQSWHLVSFLIDRMEKYSGIGYNEICEDLKEIVEGE